MVDLATMERASANDISPGISGGNCQGSALPKPHVEMMIRANCDVVQSMYWSRKRDGREKRTLVVNVLRTGISNDFFVSHPSALTISSNNRDDCCQTSLYIAWLNAGAMIRRCFRHSSPLAANILGPHILRKCKFEPYWSVVKRTR